MNAVDYTYLLLKELDRYRVVSEDPTTEPITVRILSDLLLRVVRELELRCPAS